MEWSHRNLDPSGLIRALSLPSYPACMLQRTLRRVEEPGPLCVLDDVVLATHPARLHGAPGPRRTGFGFPGGRAWRMALLPRAHELLSLNSLESPETIGSTVIGLILGALAPGGDLLGPPPTPITVSGRLANLSARWYADWADLGLTLTQQEWIKQVSFHCAAPQVEIPDPVLGMAALVRLAAYAVDQPGAVVRSHGMVHLPIWADPDLPSDVARVHLLHSLRTPVAPVDHRPTARALSVSAPG